MMLSRKVLCRTLIAVLVLSTANVFAGDEAPYKIQAAIFAKIIGFNKGLTGDIKIYVMGSADMKKYLSKGIGKKSGKGVIKSVESGSAIPGDKPSVIYIDKSISNVADVLAYCAANGVMSITGSPDYVTQGASLGVKLVGGKPKILLGTKGTKAEKIKWSPVIFKLALKI